jgi:VanZ family protein
MNKTVSTIASVRKFWISITLYIAVLLLCVIQTGHLPKAPMNDFDKLVHFLMFLGLSGAAFFDNTSYFRRATSKRSIFYGSFLLPFLLGGLIEIIQEYVVHYRTGDWMDFFFDTVGIATGAVICLLINRFLKSPING